MTAKVPPKLERDLPDFTIESVLGSGATSVVYRAKQKSLGRYVAIKRFSPETFLPASFRERFEREATLWSHFSHENLIHLYDYRTLPDARYIVLEYCHGTELRKLLEECLTLPPRVAAAVIFQALSALEYLHRFNIVHRDFKPANLFVTSLGVVKLMDFGISLCPELEPMTSPGHILGTPGYISPEQAKGREIDARSDLFAVGVVLFEMLEGIKPFHALDFPDILQELARGKFRKLSSKHPRALRNFVGRCLKAKPNRRFAGAKQAKEALERYLERDEASSPQTVVERFLRERGMVPETPTLFPDRMARVVDDDLFGTTAVWMKTGVGRLRKGILRPWLLFFLTVSLLVLVYAGPTRLRPDWPEFARFVVRSVKGWF